jgi:hypothetical protein
MLQGGILDDGSPVELLDGIIVPKDRGPANPYDSNSHHTPDKSMGHNPLHRAVVSLLQSLTGQIDSGDCFLQVQLPIDLAPDSEPEPDAAVIMGRRLDYLDRIPVASEVLSVIEAADTSLKRDSVQKKRIYAEAAIPQYILIDLVARQVSVFENPVDGTYRSSHQLSLGDQLNIQVAGGRYVSIPVSSLLPR